MFTFLVFFRTIVLYETSKYSHFLL